MAAADALPLAQPERDEILGGRYLIFEPLDSKGKVFRARDSALGRDVAVKLLGPSGPPGAAEQSGVAQALTLLSHPHVAEVYGIAEADGARYLVMEPVPGETLASALGARGPLSPLDAIRVAVQIADGLAAMHALGIVHCDVRPSNVVVTPAGSAKLVGFGMARPQGRDDSARTVDSAPYLAPERLTRREVDGRADVYSLGASLYELLTGYPPYVGSDDKETLQKALREDPVSPTLANRTVPADLSAVTLKALSRDPERRYAAVSEMADALRQAGSRLRASSGAITADFARMEYTGSLPVLVPPKWGFIRKRTIVSVLAVAALLTFALWGIVGGIPRGAATAQESPTATATTAPAPALVSTVGSVASPSPDPTATPVPMMTTTLLVGPTPTDAVPTPTASPSPTQQPAAARAPAATSAQVVSHGAPASSRSVQKNDSPPPKVSPKPASGGHSPKPAKAGKSGKGHGKKG